MEQQTKKVAVYSRKSRFTGRGESIENQIGLCRQYIRNFYGEEEELQALIYEDEGFSGGNLKRPQFMKMMRDAEKGKIRAVVVYRLDRISRNIGDFAGLIEKLGNMGISFVSIREQFDTSSPMGRAMMYIASVFSQLERETIAERIRDNMYELAKTGRWLGGNTPAGYRSEAVEHVSVDGKTRRACRLRLYEDEAVVVSGIYERFLEERSLTLTREWLLQNGCVTKNGNPFGPVAIKDILENPVYGAADEDTYRYFETAGACLCAPIEQFDGSSGIMAYNRTLQRQGRSHRVRSMEEWIIAVGEHEPLVDGKRWCRVQKILADNKKKGCRRQKSGNSLLPGLLFCGRCGSFMRPKLSQKITEEGERIFSYLCTGKEKSHMETCSVKNPDGIELDRAVLKSLSGLLEDRAEFRKLVSRRIRQLKKEAGEEFRRGSHVETAAPFPRGMFSFAPRFELLGEVLTSLPRERQQEAVRDLVTSVRWDGEAAHIYFLERGPE